MNATLRLVVEQYWTAINARDWNTFKSLVHEDVVYEMPQTRERIRGRIALTQFNATYPGNWTVEFVRVVATDDQAASEIVFRLGDTEQPAITFFTFQDGTIWRIVEYWPEPYEPPTRMTDAVERY